MLNLQETFREVGGFGTYQVLVCITGSVTCCFAGLVIAGGAFHNLLTCSYASNSNQTLMEALSADNSSSSSSSSSSRHGFTTSVSAEYGLCGNQATLGELSSVFLLAGCIPGSLLAGPAADTLGRIPGTLIGLLGSVIMNLLALLAPFFWLHLASRLLCGFFVSWALGSIYVYGNEALMTEHRGRFVKLFNLGPAIGSILLAYLAYVMRDYKRLMIASNFVAIPSALVAAVLPESPSWLLSQGSRPVGQVRRALQRIAWINRFPLPESVLALDSGDVMQLAEADHGKQEVDHTGGGSARPPAISGGSLCTALKKLLSDRLAVYYLLSTCLYSFSSGFAYYGFTFVITHAVPNIYITFALMAAVEPPSLLLLNVFSRSRTLFFSALVTVLCCFAIGVIFAAVPPGDLTLGISILKVCLAVAGKFSSNIAFCAIVAFGAEIYPTAVRNTGLGLLMATLRTGCMLSPLVNLIPYMPARFAALGLACLLAAFPTRSLPDTRIRDLTETAATGRT